MFAYGSHHHLHPYHRRLIFLDTRYQNGSLSLKWNRSGFFTLKMETSGLSPAVSQNDFHMLSLLFCSYSVNDVTFFKKNMRVPTYPRKLYTFVLLLFLWVQQEKFSKLQKSSFNIICCKDKSWRAGQNYVLSQGKTFCQCVAFNVAVVVA